jgi:hypothetical protein
MDPDSDPDPQHCPKLIIAFSPGLEGGGEGVGEWDD